MIALFGVAIVVIVGLVLFMFFILKSTVKKINSQTKLYFVDKLQEYDYLIDKKEEKLNLINKEIREKEIKSESDNEGFKKNTYEFDYQIIDLFNKTKYQDKNIFEINKRIDESFNIDYVALIKRFLDNIKDDGTYSFCTSLRNKFTSSVVYDLKILEYDMQEEYLKKILNETEFLIYRMYVVISYDDYSVDGFLGYLNELVDLNSPNIMVYVGSKYENYDYLSKYIKTIYSKDIYKGIRIIYKKRIYDYSLNERNV